MAHINPSTSFRRCHACAPEAVDVGGVYFDRLYGEVNARSVWLPSAVVFFTALLVSVAPALRAARIVPVDAMRST